MISIFITNDQKGDSEIIDLLNIATKRKRLLKNKRKELVYFN